MYLTHQFQAMVASLVTDNPSGPIKDLRELVEAMVASLVTDNPSATIKDLRELVASAPSVLGPMTLAECFNGILAAKGSSPSGPANAPKKRGLPRKDAVAEPTPKKRGRPRKNPVAEPKKEQNGQGLNPRTPSGRAHIDEVVLTHLRKLGGQAIPATAIRSSINSAFGEGSIDTAQTRTSLNRLIDLATVSYQGKARGTTYSTN